MARVLAFVAVSGCLAQTTGLVRGRPGQIEGGGVGVEGLLSKLRFGIEMGYERVSDESDESDHERHGMLGFDYVGRLGFVPLVIEDRCRSKPGTYLELRERFCFAEPWWFDVGVAGAFGPSLATSESDLVGHAWIGAWLDVRLWPSREHPVLRVEVQQDVYSGEYVGGAQFTVGLGWVSKVDVDVDD